MDWKKFLSDVSKTLLESGDLLDNFKTDGSSNWLGFQAVSEEDIQLYETRLKTKLPPSYKEFLRTTNGFKQLNCFVWDILPLQKIDWLKSFDRSFYELYACELNTFNATDEEYFIYGDDQKTTDFRSEYLIKSLAISNWGDASILLLNPEVKFGDEWEAWMFATWHLGPVRYRSFEQLMTEEYASYLDLLSGKE
jgi:hypothetical protein